MLGVIGAALLERYVVEDLLGGRLSHCFGNTFTDPATRLAFQRALARGREAIPGTMIWFALLGAVLLRRAMRTSGEPVTA